jgi:hypothetical protein
VTNPRQADIFPSPIEEMDELTKMDKATLISRYNAVAKALAEGRRPEDKQPYLVHAQIYLNEFARRRADRLTWLIALATVVMTIASILALFR